VSGGQIAVFFIDDNFAITSTTKSPLRDIIAAGAQCELGRANQREPAAATRALWDLIAASGGKWVFIGMESIDPANLAAVKKGLITW